jgi:hypothetical protein
MLLDRQALTRDGDVYRPTREIERLEVPETLQALIAARLDGLRDTERRLLQVAAVLGKTFTRPALASLSSSRESELEELLAALVRKAARLVAEESDRARLVARAGEMAYNASAPHEAQTLLEEAYASFTSLGDVRESAHVTSLLANIDFEAGHPPQAVLRLEPVIADLAGDEPDAVLAEIEGQLGRFLIFSGDYEGAAPHLERALTLAELLDLPETFVQALNSKSVLAMRLNRPREGRVLVEGALEIALAHELHSAALRAYNNRSVLLWSSDEWQENLNNTDEALELARRVGHRTWEANFLAGPIGSLDALGRWDEALARLAEAEEVATNEFGRGLMLQAVRILVARGALERARELLTENASISQSENPDFAGGYAMIESALLRAEGNPTGALSAIERALALNMPATGPGRLMLFEALEVAAALGDFERLRALLARFDGFLAGQLTQSARANRARFRAYLPEADAEAESRIAERLFEELAMPFYLAVTRLEAAERLVAYGRDAEAEPLLTSAGEAFEQLDATPWIERVARLGAALPA